MKPQFDTGGFIDLKYGVNNEYVMVQGVYNQKVNDNFAIRLGAQYFDQDGGVFYNATRDEYFDHEEGNIVRGQMRFASGALDVNVLLENQVASLPALNWQLDIAPGPGFPVGFTEQKRVYHWNSPSRAKQQITGAVLSVNHDLGWGELVSVSASRIRYTQNAFDGDGVDPPTLAAIRATGGGLTVDVNSAQRSNDRVETLYQDLHLLGNKVGGFDWLAYGKIGAAYRTGGYNRDLGDPRAPTPVIPGFGDEQSTTYEVGFKGNVRRNIYAELATRPGPKICWSSWATAAGSPTRPVRWPPRPSWSTLARARPGGSRG